MNKPLCAVYAPYETYSGYGSRSRDVIKALIELKKDEWEIKLIPCAWGNTPRNFIEDNPEWEFLNEYKMEGMQLPKQPDYWCQITIPSEFNNVGKFSFGITAGIESTVAPVNWVEGCQRMDLVLGSSQHTIDVLKSSKFQKIDERTKQPLGNIEWTKEGKVLLEGVRTDVYKPTKSNFNLDGIEESFAYLFTGQWLNGNLGEDRKNVGLLIKAFFETFKNKTKRPALILKTSSGGSSYMDRDRILAQIKAIKETVKAYKLPNIYLIHGDFTDEQMNDIYNHSKIKAMISLTKGEGFGRPLLEFSLTGKPVITTNWSGHIDFLKPEYSTLLPGELKNIHESAANQWLLKESKWFNIDYGAVGNVLVDCFKNYKNYQQKSIKQANYSKENFSWEKMKEKMGEYLNEFPTFAQPMELKLPKLNKLPKLEKVK